MTNLANSTSAVGKASKKYNALPIEGDTVAITPVNQKMDKQYKKLKTKEKLKERKGQPDMKWDGILVTTATTLTPILLLGIIVYFVATRNSNQ